LEVGLVGQVLVPHLVAVVEPLVVLQGHEDHLADGELQGVLHHVVQELLQVHHHRREAAVRVGLVLLQGGLEDLLVGTETAVGHPYSIYKISGGIGGILLQVFLCGEQRVN